jgi:hypothetical protein
MCKTKGFLSLDIDGAMVPNTFVNGIKKPISKLIDLIQLISKAGYIIVLNTGQNYKIANQFREFLKIDDCCLMVEMGNIFHKNYLGHTVLYGEDLKKFIKRKEELSIQMEKYGRIIPDTQIMLTSEHNQLEELQQVSRKISSCEIAEVYPVEIDKRLNVLPQRTHKGLITEIIPGPLLIAAGDSSSDAPMLEKAAFPIITHETGQADNTLTQIVKRKSKGYIATSEQIAGEGMFAGLVRAIQEKIITI